MFVGASSEGDRRWFWFERSVPLDEVRELAIIIDDATYHFSLARRVR